MRQVVLDTETTGLEPEEGHRVIEIGAVELVDRQKTGRHFRSYVNPERDIDVGAMEVHGITREDLADKPLFADIADDLLEFIEGAELLIHNAPFDLGFLDYEFSLLDGDGLGRDGGNFSDRVSWTDTLDLARELRPGQRNNLDALCKAYEVDNSSRTLHGALLDAEILADVYLAMTGGQVALGPAHRVTRRRGTRSRGRPYRPPCAQGTARHAGRAGRAPGAPRGHPRSVRRVPVAGGLR